jgi:peroxiredoxin
VQILGISDSNPFSQKTFADSLKLPYPLLSDFPDLQVLQRYGVLSQRQVSGSGRAFFLVDQQGVVRGRWWGEALDVFPTEEILKTAQVMAQQR